MKHTLYFFLFILLLLQQPAWAGRAKISAIARDPYVSALAIDADSGKVLFSDNAGAAIYPASVLKLMNLLVILELIEQKRLQLDDMVQVTQEAAKMGGSQVYLDPKEEFSVEELLYALMVQSANDAAVALATHIAGSKDGFVALMNQKARQLGMKNTHFHSVHGLPPAKGQEVDVTTAEDLGLLSRELSKKTEAFKYTSTKVRDFRGGKFIMRTHNHLLEEVFGCDGFKTGFFQAGGFSIVATARRNDVRIIAIVLGSDNRKVRDAKAKELLEKGFGMVPPRLTTKPSPASTPPVSSEKKDTVPVQTSTTPQTASPPLGMGIGTNANSPDWKMFLLGTITGMLLFSVLAFLVSKRKRRRYRRYSR